MQIDYLGAPVDIFSLGVILFCMRTGTMPFNQASKDDKFYQYFAKGSEHIKKFWKEHSKSKPKGLFSKEFKDLVSIMLAFDPQERPSAAKIMANAWVNDEEGHETQLITTILARKRNQKKTKLRVKIQQQEIKPRLKEAKKIYQLPQTDKKVIHKACLIKDEESKQSDALDCQVLSKRTN